MAGRKPIPVTQQVEAEIAARTARGESADTIQRALRGQLSRSKIVRIQEQQKNGTRPNCKRTPTPHTVAEVKTESKTSPEDVPENIPEDTPLETIDRWIKMIDRGMRTAEADGNLTALSSLAMRSGSLMEVRRKATPLPKPDPNEDDEFRTLAKLGEDRFAKLVASLFDVVPST